MHKLWKWLEYWDQTLFLKINQDGANPLFDATLPWIRESSFWLPLYLFLAIFILYNFGWRGIIWALAFGLAIGLADNISSKIIKYAFMRQRPCQDAFFAPYVRMFARGCPGNPSFTSSHAANHFAMAAFAFSAGNGIFGRWRRWFFLWAFLISYAQVYIGIHYPLDIIGGAVVGMLIGLMVANVYNRRFSLFEVESNLSHRTKEERRNTTK